MILLLAQSERIYQNTKCVATRPSEILEFKEQMCSHTVHVFNQTIFP